MTCLWRIFCWLSQRKMNMWIKRTCLVQMKSLLMKPFIPVFWGESVKILKKKQTMLYSCWVWLLFAGHFYLFVCMWASNYTWERVISPVIKNEAGFHLIHLFWIFLSLRSPLSVSCLFNLPVGISLDLSPPFLSTFLMNFSASVAFGVIASFLLSFFWSCLLAFEERCVF